MYPLISIQNTVLCFFFFYVLIIFKMYSTTDHRCIKPLLFRNVGNLFGDGSKIYVEIV